MNRNKIIGMWITSLLLLGGMVLLSITLGAKAISLEEVFASFSKEQSTFTALVIQERIPRTLFGILAGAALAVSGCIMQTITRNPIADPSILGVNTGASLAVVIGIAFFSISSATEYIWLAFFGALITAIIVYGLASTGYGGATPMKLALAGAAMSTALASLVNTIMLPNAQVMDSFRFWQAGSIAGANWDTIQVILPYLIIGFVICFWMTHRLNVLALGDEMASGLGINTKRTRYLSAFAAVLLCSAITALAGPIGFIGLMVPHFVRMKVSSDMKVLLPLSAITGSSLLLCSDVVGRLLIRPAELEVGIVTAMIGAPVFIWIVRKAKVRSL